MRIPQQRPIRSVRATQPSTPPATVRTTGNQGTPGGTTLNGNAVRRPGLGRKGSMKIGAEKYLWILIFIEIALMGGFRKYFRRFHGG
jgi:hypothetical protein